MMRIGEFRGVPWRGLLAAGAVVILALSAGLVTVASAATITEFTVSPSCCPGAITAGPDGALWFTASNKIGRITTAGTITEFAATSTTNSSPEGITAGLDGAL